MARIRKSVKSATASEEAAALNGMCKSGSGVGRVFNVPVAVIYS